MNESAVDTYYSRFRKILEYIDANLDNDLTVEHLSSVAAFSKYHFHRQFSELFGMSVYKYVQLTCLKRASYQLAFRERMQIVDISLVSGYENHESFSRAFKKSIGQTPSEFRECPQWNPWHLIYQPLSDLRSEHKKPDNQPENIKVILFKETKVVVLEHRGEPKFIGDSVREFIEWRKQNNLPPQSGNTFNILYDNPSENLPENFRLDICASTDRDVLITDLGL